MASLLMELGRRYDVVLVDTAPVVLFADALVIATRCDGAIFIARYGRTARQQVSEAVSSLKAVSVALLGTVMSMAPQSKPPSYYSYYSDESHRAPEHRASATVGPASMRPARKSDRDDRAATTETFDASAARRALVETSGDAGERPRPRPRSGFSR